MKTNTPKEKMLVICVSMLLLFSFILSSCTPAASNDPKPSNLATKPEALAAYDHSSAGIVKGILVGSTGIFKFNIKNGNDSVYCDVTFDGQSGRLLPTTNMSAWQPGQAFAATFSGTVGGVTVSVYFKCNADGSSPSASFTIPNHTVSVSLYKETSTALVKAYEGSYKVIKISDSSVTNSGIFNVVVYNGVAAGQRTDTGGTFAITGTVANGKLTMGTDVLDITDTSVSGTLMKDTEKVVVTGTRTL